MFPNLETSEHSACGHLPLREMFTNLLQSQALDRRTVAVASGGCVSKKRVCLETVEPIFRYATTDSAFVH